MGDNYGYTEFHFISNHNYLTILYIFKAIGCTYLPHLGLFSLHILDFLDNHNDKVAKFSG